MSALNAKRPPLSLLVLAAGWVVASPVAAQVVLDGTAGPAGALGGPDYAIGADLGRRAGANLFHSFERFSLATGESATFSGPAGIENVIGRVTGGERSDIDGTLRSTIPGADLWFLNPAGVVFGPNARLDLRGSFHVSTADELRFAGGARFSARDPGASTFTVAPPQAFGFLGARPGPIAATGGLLQVPAGETVSLVGGDVSLVASGITAPGGRVNLIGGAPGEAVLPSGEAGNGGGAVPGRGAVTLTGSTVLTEGDGGGSVVIRGGEVVLEGGGVLANNLGDRDGGGVSIAGDGVRLDGATIGSLALAAGDAGPIAVDAGRLDVRNRTFVISSATAEGTGAGGDITLTVGSLNLSGGSSFNTDTFGAGRSADMAVTATDAVTVTGAFSRLSVGTQSDSTGAGGRLAITAPRLEVGDGGSLVSGGFGAGDGGDIALAVGRLDVMGGGTIRATAVGAGAAGDLTVTAGEAVTVGGSGVVGGIPVRSGLSAGASALSTGPGGRLTITAPLVEVRDGGFVESLTGGTGPGGNVVIAADRLVVSGSDVSTSSLGSGRAGNVSVTATESVALRDSGFIAAFTTSDAPGGRVTVATPRLDLTARSIITTSTTNGRGDGGPLDLSVGRLTVTDGGLVTTSTNAAGRAGDLTIVAAEGVRISGADSALVAGTSAVSSGPGGTIRVTAPRVVLADGGGISARSRGTGAAGDVVITAPDRLELSGGAEVSTEAASAGGGRIAIRVGDRIDLRGGSAITTSVVESGAAGDGGDIAIDPRFLILDGARIQANAVRGDGGNIDIRVGALIRTPDSVIEATSSLGIDGTISVSAPDEDVSSGLVALPAVFLDASGLLRESCAARRSGDVSSFTAAGRGGLPPGPDGPLPGFYILGDGGPAGGGDAASLPSAAVAAARASASAVPAAALALACGDAPG